jgi:hypothetical protein
MWFLACCAFTVPYLNEQVVGWEMEGRGYFEDTGFIEMTTIVPHGFEPNYTAGFVKGLLANGIDVCVISSDTDHRKLQKDGIQCVNLRGCQDHDRFWMTKVVNILKYYILLVLYLFRHREVIIHFTGLFRNG